MHNENFKSAKSDLALSFRQGFINAECYLISHSNLTDKLLTYLFKKHINTSDCALIALGGYGRRELYPFSDIDILILVKNSEDVSEEDIGKFLNSLWDVGLKIGHSVRTVEECIINANADITIQTSLLQSRLICGEQNLINYLSSLLAENLNIKNFIHAKLLEQTARHHRYHNIDSSLEPNIKESPGGLREIHMLSFIDSAINSKVQSFESNNHHSFLGDFIIRWQSLQWLSAEEAVELTINQNFLQELRVHLHLFSNRPNDRLLFDYQEILAEKLGFNKISFAIDSNLRPAERLMKRYYRMAMKNLQITKLLIESVSAEILKTKTDKFANCQRLEYGLVIRTDSIIDVIDEGCFTKTPENCLKPYLFQYQGLANEISPEVKRLIGKISRYINNFRHHPTLQKDFISLIKLPHGVITTLRELNRIGFLGGYIVPFGNIVGQMQYDLYHAYTVDQHTLMVVRNLRRYMLEEFSHEFPEHSKVMAEFPKPWVLIIAALFHDIAKGRGGDHSTLGMVDARKFCLAHNIDDDDCELIEWLVGEHLKMSKIAQSSDLADSEVISKFCEKVQNTYRLDALYLLTVADIRGTAPSVWTPWKDKLLSTLYRESNKYLQQKLTNTSPTHKSTTEALELALQKLTWKKNTIDKTLEKLTPEYLTSFDTEDIVWHLTSTKNTHENVEQLGQQLQIAIRNHSSDNEKPNQKNQFLHLMVVANEILESSQELFGRVCGHLSHLHYSVMNAQSMLWQSSQKLLHFQIEPAHEIDKITTEQLILLEQELAKRLTDKNIPRPIITHIPRHMRHSIFKPQARIMQDASAHRYIVSIATADRLGLLYDLTRHFAKFQANIINARINTLGARAENSFVIECPQLKNTNVLFEFEKDLLEVLAIRN